MNVMISGILPRFMNSPEHAKMLEFVDGSEPLPNGSSLDVPPPYRSIYTVMDLDILPTKKFSCRELVSDRLLYHQFYTYLRQHDVHDSLLGVRMLTIFEERITVKDWEHAEQVAWEIYRYFVAPDSSFAVEIDDIELKEILRRYYENIEILSNPTPNSTLLVVTNKYGFFISFLSTLENMFSNTSPHT